MIKLLRALTAILSVNSFAIPLAISHSPQVSQQSDKQDSQILSLDDYIKEALYSDFRLHHPNVFIKSLDLLSKNLTYKNISVTPKADSYREGQSTGIYFGKAIFENPTDEVQNYLTPGFIQKVSNTYTYQTVEGISAGIEAKFKFLGFNYKANFSKTDADTQIVTETLTAPSQTIKVEPHTRTTIQVYLGATKGDAKLNLNADITGTVKCEINKIGGVGITYEVDVVEAFKALQQLSELPSTISISDDNVVHFQGLGIISGLVTETNYYVKVKDSPLE